MKKYIYFFERGTFWAWHFAFAFAGISILMHTRTWSPFWMMLFASIATVVNESVPIMNRFTLLILRLIISLMISYIIKLILVTLPGEGTPYVSHFGG